MITFTAYMEKQHIKIPENMTGEWFITNKLPMVVRCTCCDMTMTLPAAMIDDEGYTYCTTCADEDEDDDVYDDVDETGFDPYLGLYTDDC